jgi:hypothetical protein
MESLTALIEEYRDHKRMHCMEGSRGVENLCKLVRALGYRDSMNRMQFRDGCLGDLLEFLEDNSGAIEAIVTWIGEREIPEWKEAIESELPERGTCPACGEPLQDDVCQNTDCDS